MANKIILLFVVVFVTEGAFEETVQEGDLLTHTFTKFKNGTYSTYDNQTIGDCFKMHNQNFQNMANQLESMVKLAATKIVQTIKDQNIEDLMKNISDSFKQLPDKIWPKVEQANFVDALKEAETTGHAVNTAANTVVAKLKRKNRTVAQQAISEFNNIKNVSESKSRHRSKRIMLCINVGGPSKMTSERESNI